MIKRLLYAIIGLLIGAAFYTFCLINVPQDDMGGIITSPNITDGSQTNIPTEYQPINPIYFDSYYLSDSDVTMYETKGIVHYGAENPMWLRTVTPIPTATPVNPDDTDQNAVSDTNNPSANDVSTEDDVTDTSVGSTSDLSENISVTNAPSSSSEQLMSDVFNTSLLDGYTIGFDLSSNDQSINLSDCKLINTDSIMAVLQQSSSFPLPFGDYSITSEFGERPYVDITPDVKSPDEPDTEFHSGIDLSKDTIEGTEIRSITAGTVESIHPVDEDNSGSGNYVVINHGTFKTLYAHMSSFAEGLKVNDKVDAGTVLGYVGSTGRSTGPHLHFEILVDQYCIDPKPFLNKILNN